MKSDDTTPHFLEWYFISQPIPEIQLPSLLREQTNLLITHYAPSGSVEGYFIILGYARFKARATQAILSSFSGPHFLWIPKPVGDLYEKILQVDFKAWMHDDFIVEDFLVKPFRWSEVEDTVIAALKLPLFQHWHAPSLVQVASSSTFSHLDGVVYTPHSDYL